MRRIERVFMDSGLGINARVMEIIVPRGTNELSLVQY
jgi:hypothetical protein